MLKSFFILNNLKYVFHLIFILQNLEIVFKIVFAYFIVLFLPCGLGLGCSTVLSPEGAALNAAQILALSDHVIWSKLRAKKLNTWVGLKQADKKIRDDQ